MNNLLLLHGAIGAQDQLLSLKTRLSRKYEVFTLNFSGHGGRQFPGSTFSISAFAEDVLRFMRECQLERVNIFGYSMGGYVGSYLAKYHPEKVERLITLATKFYWDETVAQREIHMIDRLKIESKLPAFAEILRKRHLPNDWKLVLAQTAEMLRALGVANTLTQEDYAFIIQPVLILIGDRDKMIPLEETINIFKALPNAQMGMIPNTAHPIEQTNLNMLANLIEQFLEN